MAHGEGHFQWGELFTFPPPDKDHRPLRSLLRRIPDLQSLIVTIFTLQDGNSVIDDSEAPLFDHVDLSFTEGRHSVCWIRLISGSEPKIRVTFLVTQNNIPYKPDRIISRDDLSLHEKPSPVFEVGPGGKTTLFLSESQCHELLRYEVLRLDV